MALISVIRDEKIVEANFFSFDSSCKEKLLFSSSKIVKNNKTSLVAMTDNEGEILKLVRPKSWHESGKYFYGRSRLTKELRGNEYLSSLGLSVPKIKAYGYGFPFAKSKYLGFIVMKNLKKDGCVEAEEAFLSHSLTAEDRSIFYNNLIKDLKLMISKKVIFSDLTLSNFFVGPKLNVVWIDTGITFYSRFSKNKFSNKLEYTIKRFINRHNCLHSDEVAQIMELIES